MLCGRTAPPAPLARFALHQGAVTAEHLKLDSDEASALLEQIDPVGNRNAEALRTFTQGWVAGFTLLATRPGELPNVGRRLTPDDGDALFAYFTEEVLTRCDAAERDFLVAMAPLGTFTLAQARTLTGREDAEKILENLRCGQFFIPRLTGEPPSYRCHPLFHEFLYHVARNTLAAREWLHLRLNAAELAEAEGDIETAVSLYIDAEAWTELARLLCRIAPALVAQSRHALLEVWIGQVPSEVLGRSPWLHYWLGTAQVYVGQTTVGRIQLECAYRGFEATDDRDGLLLAWGGILESYCFEWDDCSAVAAWADRIERVLPDDLVLLPPMVLARLLGTGMALQVVDRAHPVSHRLTEAARGVFGRPGLEAVQGPAATLLLIDQLYGGDFAAAQALLDRVMGMPDFARWPPVVRILFGQFRAACAWQTGNPEQAYELVEQVLGVAQQTGIRGRDFVTTTQGMYAALCVRDEGRAHGYLSRLQVLLRSDRRGDAAHLDALNGCYKFLLGDLSGARIQIERGAKTFVALGMGFAALVARVMLAWVLLMLGEFGLAGELMRDNIERTRAAKTSSIEFESWLSLAYAELVGGDRDTARAALREAFSLGRQRHYFFTGPVWLPEVMSRLCAEALVAGIEPGYTREFITRRALLPPALTVEHWPWPVRIHTLGRFGIFIAGQPLELHRKGQGKPIQLLQALIALGGRDVAVATLQDLLWPDAEGDDADNAFHVNLLRLRRLLGESVLKLRDRRVSLDERCCWVDTWVLSRLLTSLETGLATNHTGCFDPRILSEQAFGLYRGSFLPGEDSAWAATTRARLRSRFLRLQVGCARSLWETDACVESAILCRRVLEIEPVAEEILVELLHALLAGGLTAQATAALRESELIFQRLLGRSLSPALWTLLES